MDDMEKRVLALENRVTAVEQAVHDNTALTREIKTDTAKLIVILESSKIFARVLSWAAGLAASVAGVYAIVKGLK